MQSECVGGLEVTYGNALAAGGGFHRVTTAEGAAAEIAPHTYLWYKLTVDAKSAITQLRVAGSELLDKSDDNASAWRKLDKSIDRQNALFLWFQCNGGDSKLSSAASPLKEIRVVRNLIDVPEDFEHLPEPIVTPAANSNDSKFPTSSRFCCVIDAT